MSVWALIAPQAQISKGNANQDDAPRAYVIDIGVGRTPESPVSLPLAASDARAFSSDLRGALLHSGRFKEEDLVSIVLTDEPLRGEGLATVNNIECAFHALYAEPLLDDECRLDKTRRLNARAIPGYDRLRPTRQKDTVIITVSAHGFYEGSEDEGDPSTSQQVEVLASDAEGAGYGFGAVDGIVTEYYLESLQFASSDFPKSGSGLVLFILDTCEAAGSTTAHQAPSGAGDYGFGQWASKSNWSILSATSHNSFEIGSLQRSLLAYALLEEGLGAGLADLDHDHILTFNEWLNYAVQRVPQLVASLRQGQSLRSPLGGYTVTVRALGELKRRLGAEEEDLSDGQNPSLEGPGSDSVLTILSPSRARQR
jgi:hypothetical protein